MWGENKLIIQQLTGSKWQRWKNKKGLSLLYMQSDGKIKKKSLFFFFNKGRLLSEFLHTRSLLMVINLESSGHKVRFI